MTQRIPGTFSTVDWSLDRGNTMPPENPTTMMMMTGTKTAIPNLTISASRRSLESPTKTNKRESSHSNSPALISARLDEWPRTSWASTAR